MTYYQILQNIISNPNRFQWDYYKCHSKMNMDDIFHNPNDFISWTFLCAKKERLTSSVVFDEYQFKTPCLSNARAAHSISSFFLGFILAKGLIGENLNSFCSYAEKCTEFSFSYVWNLTSLYHDYGYQFEKDKDLLEKVQYSILKRDNLQNIKYSCAAEALKSALSIKCSIWRPRYLEIFFDHCFKTNADIHTASFDMNAQSEFSTAKNTIEKYIHDNINAFQCNNSIIKIPFRSCNTISKYLMYRLFENPEYACIDHGISGGMYFYDRIIKSYIYEY